MGDQASRPPPAAGDVPAAGGEAWPGPGDWAGWRTQFPILARRTYLNSGSCGALALSVRAAMEDYLDLRMQEGADWGLWLERFEALRASLAGLLGVEAAELALTASASAGLNSLASALSFDGPRRRVVVSDFEFPTSAQIWHAQARRGAEVVHVPASADGTSVPLAHFERLIDERTALVAVTHVCYRNGARLDIPAIVELAHARGARVLLDAYQSVGAGPLDLRALGVDFAVGGMMKYLLGTSGSGFLFVRGELVPALEPLATGWLAQADVAAMDITRHVPAPDARRFEAGTPGVANAQAAAAGIAILRHVGLAAVGARVEGLVTRCLEALADSGIAVATPLDPDRRGATVAIRARDQAALVERLAAHGIVTSCRDGNVRASFHFYNDERDIARLITALEAERALLA